MILRQMSWSIDVFRRVEDADADAGAKAEGGGSGLKGKST
jgi:hypothetical protein